MSWTIAAPVWGDEYHKTFATVAPSILAMCQGRKVRFIIHTDSPDAVRSVLGDEDLTFRPVPSGKLYEVFGACHREAVQMAPDGPVMLLQADVLPSVETMGFCERVFDAGKKLVLSPALRTLPLEASPVAPTAKELAAWKLRNLHPAVQDIVWGREYMGTPGVLLFRAGETLVLRGFHLHPIAFIKTPGLDFEGTCDAGLLEQFTCSETYVPRDLTQFCLAELSPPDKDAGALMRANVRSLARWALTCTAETHRRLFVDHRILIAGPDAETPDISVAAQLADAFESDRLPL